jgi:hypothetical protein
MRQLMKELVFTQFTNSAPIAQQTSTNYHSLNIPQSTVEVLRPITYEFRVVEYTDENNKVVKVGLQSRETEHSFFGGSVEFEWVDVPRICLPMP